MYFSFHVLAIQTLSEPYKHNSRANEGQNLGVAKTRTADTEENFGQYCSTFKI